jgi:hypothetical protein
MKIKGLFLSATLTAVLCISGSLFAYSGGDGSTGIPFQIANVTDFQQLSATSADWSKSFVLTANIDLTGQTFTQAPIAPDIGALSEFQGTKFTGVFDGNGHVISKLTVTASTKDFIGLFGCVGSGGQVRNLGVENVNITGYYYVGGVAANNSGAIDACHVTGSCSGYQCVGGVAGDHYGTVTSCYAAGTVSGNFYAGGVVGCANGTITSCHATASVSGTTYVGGVVGCTYYSLMSCYATGMVSGNSNVGGLVGCNSGKSTLMFCYATGSVSGTTYVGGLVGLNYKRILTSCYASGSVIGTGDYVGGLVGTSNTGAITSCYATGSVGGANYVGGLVGTISAGTATFCYATGSVTGTNYAGGLAGTNSGTLTGCFWDTQAGGTSDGVGNVDPDPAGVTGKTTIEMKTLLTFTNAVWDFTATDGDPADWWMPANSYPQLAWPIIGDIAGLYGVNLIDFAVFAAHWDQTGCPSGCENADINNSGTVDITDLLLFADNWLKGI